MAEAIKKTERVEKVAYEDVDVVTLTMSVDEATAVHSALWLIEMERANDRYVAFKGVQDALGIALDFPIAQFRFDKDNSFNNGSCVYVYERD